MIHIKIISSEFIRVTMSGVFACGGKVGSPCGAREAPLNSFKYIISFARAAVLFVFSFKSISTATESRIC